MADFGRTTLLCLLALFLLVYAVYHSHGSTVTQKHSSSTAIFSGIPSLKNREKNSNIARIEDSLARARSTIYKAARTRSRRHHVSEKNETWKIPTGPAYRNSNAFFQSYKEMERRFKVWVYKEGEPPLFHTARVNSIYSIEAEIIHELENSSGSFLAHSPDQAAAFFLPIGMANIRHYTYAASNDYGLAQFHNVVNDYIQVLSHKYHFWNTSSGADHFFVGCHDWAPYVLPMPDNPNLFNNLIRALCNANISQGFNPTRDVSLPEIKILEEPHLGQPLLGLPPHHRQVLAFFAGGAHGFVRQKLLSCWKNKDREIQVHEYLPENVNYYGEMGRSKFCLCASGYEVASPRVVESISTGCVPVIISDAYVLPFSDVLDWTQFSVHVPVARIPQLKSILKGISMDDYLKKQKNVMLVQKHFVLHRPAQPFDLLHMVFHSIWLRRLNVRLSL